MVLSAQLPQLCTNIFSLSKSDTSHRQMCQHTELLSFPFASQPFMNTPHTGAMHLLSQLCVPSHFFTVRSQFHTIKHPAGAPIKKAVLQQKKKTLLFPSPAAINYTKHTIAMHFLSQVLIQSDSCSLNLSCKVSSCNSHG